VKKDPKYARRLLKLAEFLEQLPRKRFNFGDWVGPDWKGAKNLSCGTTACALGWATAIPEFRRLGLALFPYENMDGQIQGGHIGLTHDDMAGEHEAAEHVFGLDVENGEFEQLFMPTDDGYDGTSGLPASATAKQVARHIRAFVKRETGRAS
jgi:hypothetical protein